MKLPCYYCRIVNYCFQVNHIKSKQTDHFLSFKAINGKRTCAHTLNTASCDFWNSRSDVFQKIDIPEVSEKQQYF